MLSGDWSCQSDMETDSSSVPDTLWFSFKLIIIGLWRSMQILFTNRALPIIRHRDQIGGEVSPCSLKVTVAMLYMFTSLSSRFRPSSVHGAMAEMAEISSRASGERHGSHQWAITCRISDQSFYIWPCSDVAKMWMAPPKGNIYNMQNFAISVIPG